MGTKNQREVKRVRKGGKEEGRGRGRENRRIRGKGREDVEGKRKVAI